MHFGDHAPPHFHAHYGEHEALVSIESPAVMRGHLPPRANELVVEWAGLHRAELEEAWHRAERQEAPERIAPLP